MNIIIATSHLCKEKGGCERVAVRMAEEMAARGHQAHIFAYDFGQGPKYPVPAHIPLHTFPLQLGDRACINQARALLATIGADVCVSLQGQAHHIIWALCCLGTGVPFICSERSDPEFEELFCGYKPARHAALACADAIHEFLPVYAQSVPECWQHKVTVIPNAAPASMPQAENPDPLKTLLYLGRFEGRKRIDLLIQAFSLLAPQFPQWRLRLVGGGPQAKTVRQWSKTLIAQGRMELCDFISDVGAAYAKADIFCQPTLSEGIPNSVLEAMSAGLPIVGVADCPAMRALVGHGKNGLLAAEPMPEVLAKTLQPLMESADLRQQLGRQAREDSQGRYGAKLIFDQWEELLLNTARHKGNTVMDRFSDEPFASRARLSAVARREWLFRDFGQPMPYTAGWLGQRIMNFMRSLHGLPYSKHKEDLF